jgi:hypothetical protein
LVGKRTAGALAYVAHRDCGDLFGTAYDPATITILWFAGATPSRRMQFGLVSGVFAYTTSVNIVERPEGLTIALWFFGWTEGNPVTCLLKFLAFGEGDTAPVAREVLRQAEPDRRPRIHVC